MSDLTIHMYDPDLTIDTLVLQSMRVSKGVGHVIVHIDRGDSTDGFVVGPNGVVQTYVTGRDCGCP